MDNTKLASALVHLCEQVGELRADQARQNSSIEEVLKVWHQSNLRLLEILQMKTEDLSGLTQQERTLTECILALTRHTGELGVATNELGYSLENLTSYLSEEQAPQVVHLAENTAALKDSSADLLTFVTGEQTQRAKTLEEGMRSLIVIMEQTSGRENVSALPSKEKKAQSFSRIEYISQVLCTSLCTATLL